MIQKYNLTLSDRYYCDKSGRRILCAEGLNEYFDLDDKPKEITVTLSTKPSKISYKAKFRINVVLKWEGRYRGKYTLSRADSLFRRFLAKAKVKHAYISLGE